jgi:type IV pilus assembly protein PilE
MVAAIVHTSPGRRAVSGFTLIELMIVVAVVAILAVIAYPSFIEQVRKSRRQEAISLIGQIAQAQERWRGSCPTYATLPNTATAAFPNNCTVATSGLGVLNPSSGYYTASITAATASSYTINATAAGAQSTDTNCAVLRLVMAGGNLENWAGSSVATLANAATNANARKCWSR